MYNIFMGMAHICIYIGSGVWMGWHFQEVPGGTGGDVVAGKLGTGFIVQVMSFFFL